MISCIAKSQREKAPFESFRKGFMPAVLDKAFRGDLTHMNIKELAHA
jgi:hypothetical protein